MNRFIVSLLLFTGLSALAQIHQSLPDGYLIRASLMLENGNLAGCADQLSVFDHLAPGVGQRQTADWIGAIHAAKSGAPYALRRLE
ncbi:MAG: hypothetical protein K2M76_03455, partial [Muribaculaceae bacterium]|nr:hypothetical protein [Muribaculaceae bacterium]